MIWRPGGLALAGWSVVAWQSFTEAVGDLPQSTVEWLTLIIALISAYLSWRSRRTS